MSGLLSKQPSIDPAHPGYGLHDCPPWALERTNLHKNYTANLTMSSVSVDMTLEPFVLRGLFAIFRDVRGIKYEGFGHIINVSDSNDTTDEDELHPPPRSSQSRKGRSPINPPTDPRRGYGKFRSFGRSLEIRLLLELVRPFKNCSTKEYCIKFFPTKIQVPGCCDEQHTDVNRIIEFVKIILKQGYARIPPPPPGLDQVTDIIREARMRPLIHMRPQDVTTLQTGSTTVYSRNYTFHYLPLVTDLHENGEQRNVLNIYNINQTLLNLKHHNPTALDAMLSRNGLEAVVAETTGISETANRRLQLVFPTPQAERQADSRKAEVTKGYLEATGKLNIDLSNRYLWTDVLWRIFCFTHEFINVRYIQPRIPAGIRTHDMTIMAQIAQVPKTDDEIRRFIALQITPDPSSDSDDN